MNNHPEHRRDAEGRLVLQASSALKDIMRDILARQDELDAANAAQATENPRDRRAKSQKLEPKPA
jgi:hypothetical protein